jgi:hypothetical protein
MSTETIIYVLGTPSGGTSVAAGILHHLGVYMGNIPPLPGKRGYMTFECRNARQYVPESPNPVAEVVAGKGGSRNFRAYLRWRLSIADSAPQGVKLGAAYWLGDPDPASLPIRILRVHRPLIDSIRSDARYQRAIRDSFTAEDHVLRCAQIAGYFVAADELCLMIRPTLQLQFCNDLLGDPTRSVKDICRSFNIHATQAQESAAISSVDPTMRHV